MQIKPYDEIKVFDVVNVTGLSVYKYKEIAHNLQRGGTVSLRRDPSNKYDTNATGVYWRDQQIGWIPKSSNSDFAKKIPSGKVVIAHIVEHDTGSSDISKRLFIQIKSAQDISFAREDNSLGWDSFAAKLDANKIETPKQKLNELLKPKETKMNELINKTISRNSANATSAAFLEAGRIANRQATKFASKHLPMMVRGYADTAVGRLVLANIAATASAQFRPTDKRLARLADAMMVTAYQEVLQSFDIEKMIEDMVSNETIKKALTTLDANDADAV